MWGIVPAAGAGSRIQPLAFSKELLPVGSRIDDDGVERPRAVSEYLVERMIRGGADKICFVISPGKHDIVQYYGGGFGSANVCYAVQPRPAGLCDSIFRVLPLLPPSEDVLVGLPDTVWFPEDGLRALPDGILSFLLFPVDRPEYFDAVVTDEAGRVREIQVKQPGAATHWVWGAFKLPGRTLAELHELWLERGKQDEYIGTLVNAWLARGGEARGVPAGETYVDVGTVHGYREAIQALADRPAAGGAAPLAAASAVWAADLVPSTWCQVPGARHLVPGAQYRTTCRLSATRFSVLGTSETHDQPGATTLISPHPAPAAAQAQGPEEIARRVRELGPWFHNLELRGVQTAPDHFLGDYPTIKWRTFAHAVPEDLTGRSVLDIGCNAGFYSMEMKRRGAARVVGIDSEDLYLNQARFAAEVNGMDIEFRKLSVYDVAELGEKFDFVIFMGVLYHLRHPLLALDLLYEHVVGDLMLFQSMQRGSPVVDPVQADYDFWQQDHFDSPGYPRMAFIEHRYCGDPTNWWVPNAAATEAMLRSAGFEIVEHPEQEVYLCRRGRIIDGEPRAVYPSRGGGGR